MVVINYGVLSNITKYILLFPYRISTNAAQRPVRTVATASIWSAATSVTVAQASLGVTVKLTLTSVRESCVHLIPCASIRQPLTSVCVNQDMLVCCRCYW